MEALPERLLANLAVRAWTPIMADTTDSAAHGTARCRLSTGSTARHQH
jgi:hypothetical protein